jgi:hypothetical protein
MAQPDSSSIASDVEPLAPRSSLLTNGLAPLFFS